MRVFGALKESIRRYFVAGILTFAPIGVTLWALAWIVERLDNLLLPHLLRLALPNVDETFRLPLAGAAFTILVILLFGVIARHLFGLKLVKLGEQVLRRVPIARSIYIGIKQLTEAIFSTKDASSFRKVALIEYPRRGIFALTFVTGPARGVVKDALDDKEMVNCFIPTTPNPTSGFYLLVPEEELIAVDISVEDAFKLVMSAGLVFPGDKENGAKAATTQTASSNSPAS